MLNQLSNLGYDIQVTNHALAVLSADFPQPMQELQAALTDFVIPVEDLIASGGGEAVSTQRLRNRLNDLAWPKHNFEFRTIVDGTELQSISHEIDHVRRSPAGTIALEIEWNNKDPFFDRDLENFQRLHSQSVISLGVIVTRGASLQGNLVTLVQDCLTKHNIECEDDLSVFEMKDRTARQRRIVQSRMEREHVSYAQAFAKAFVADKFGTATTHWEKLTERVARGVGNPCPLLLVGIPDRSIAV